MFYHWHGTFIPELDMWSEQVYFAITAFEMAYTYSTANPIQESQQRIANAFMLNLVAAYNLRLSLIGSHATDIGKGTKVQILDCYGKIYMCMIL